MGQLLDMTSAFIMLGLLCAAAGWAIIEGLIWVFSHVRVVLV